MVQINLIAAIDLNFGIGIDNRLPWHIPEDLQRFKQLTMGHTVIMGRKTFESIGKPLPGRRNIVITRNRDWKHEGVEVVHSTVHALAAVHDEDQAFVIGGADIFERFLFNASRIMLTLVYDEYLCDSYFPYFLDKKWHVTDFEPGFSPTGKVNYVYLTYENQHIVREYPITIREHLRRFWNGFKAGMAFKPFWNSFRKTDARR